MILEFIRAMRPKRWAKNGVMVAGIAFGLNLTDPDALLRVAGAIFIFCMLSGSSYVINDLFDIRRDRTHPVKSRRAIASGRMPAVPAAVAACIIALASLAGGYFIGQRFFLAAVAFFAIQTAYSAGLSRIVVMDLFAMAATFLLRVVAGAWAVPVPVSQWLLVCTMLLALLMAIGTRRHELVVAGEDVKGHNPVLREYNPYLMDQMIAVVTSATLVAYALYTQSAETVEKFGTRQLILSTPFVLYGIFRYLYLIHRREGELSPEKLLLTDRPFQLTLLAYAITCAAILYT